MNTLSLDISISNLNKTSANKNLTDTPQLRKIAVCIMVCTTFLSGCSVTYPLVGAYSDSEEILVGSLHQNLSAGGATFQFKSETTSLACSGIGERPYFVPPGSGLSCEGQRGRGSATCSDGRTLNFEWVADACTVVRGDGKDSLGNRFNFLADLNKDIPTMKSSFRK